ncbi:hypothetical protein WICMUC_004467 [Wickerhamomyces mucosus]|uniref:TBP-associated factor 6 n=1 Tax=Wickerhamomyces mucosus TaxID=1378264 RepID=A0A9P8TBE5_9ASCO|nr:hypothetical protein WICMUC_004467 [Wickerhamomyces mucosus]
MAQQRPTLSHTLWSPIDTVKDVADSLGLSDLNDETSRNLAMDVEYRIHEILEQAIKFMRHSKRKTLTTNDISKALKILNVEPLYGYDVSRNLNFKEALVGNGQTLYYIDEEELDFEKLINEPLPKVPRLPNFTAHWLAIEGVQPTIPQNPLISDIKQILPIQRGAITNILTTESSYQQSSNQTSNEVNDTTQTKNNINQSSTSDKDIEIKPLVKHVLSKELQLYFNKVIQALSNQSDDENALNLKNAALSSLRSDPGLHQLVPYFIQFTSEQITHNLNNLGILSTMLELIYSILSNDNIFLDPYIHSLIPSILTLLLAKRIGKVEKDDNLQDDDAHLAVREFASSLLEHVCKKFSKNYSTLKPRVTRTLLKAFLDSNKPIGTVYGSLIGLRIMGNEVVRFTLLGNLKSWSTIYLDNASEKDQKLLIATLIKILQNLKTDLNLSDEMEVELSEQELEKLSNRIGNTLSKAISNEKDSKLIYDAIFFGDLE